MGYGGGGDVMREGGGGICCFGLCGGVFRKIATVDSREVVQNNIMNDGMWIMVVNEAILWDKWVKIR